LRPGLDLAAQGGKPLAVQLRHMKKFVFILLLALMPLQASWGVVSMYVTQQHETCLHPCRGNQAVQTADNDQAPADTAGAHHEDRFCGLHALAVVDSLPSNALSFSSPPALSAYEPRFVPQIVIDRPERPKWLASA